jgi:hypothetical protein
MNEEQIADVWNIFKNYLDKKHVETAAERFVDLLADYGIDDITFKELLGTDKDLDVAISYYLEDDAEDDNYNDEWDE